MATGNLSQQYSMDPIPLPQAPQPPAQQLQDPRLDQSTQAQVPPVYYGGKTGSVAHIADSVLRGWMAGTTIAQQRKQQAMTNEVSGAKTGLDYIGQAYRSAVESGDQAKIKQTEGALSEAWNDYLNKAEKYAMPDAKMDPKTGKPKKEGIGQRLKEGFSGGPAPNIGIAHSSLDILRKTDPRSMYGPSKAEQQQAKLTDMQLTSTEMGMKDQQAKDAAMKTYADALKKPAAQRTPEENQAIDFTESYYFGKSDEQKSRDKILGKISNGGQLSDGERQLAEGYGMIKPKVTQTLVNQTVDAKGRPIAQLISVGPDGQVVGKADLGRTYVPPDQAQIATQMLNGQVSALVKLGKKAHPEWDDKTAYQAALASVAPNLSGAGDWYTKNQEADVMNRGINAVLQKHASKHRDANGNEIQSYDQIGEAAKTAFVSQGDDGRYYYASQLGVKPETKKTWWGLGDDKTTIMGMPQEQAAGYEKQFLGELRAELKRQNPKLPDSELDKMMPQALMRAGMQPPTGGTQQASGDPMQAPPGSSMPAMYAVLLPNGQRVTRRLSREQADALKFQGVNATLMGGLTDQVESNGP